MYKKALDKDVQFLEENNLMDYSLLIVIYDARRETNMFIRRGTINIVTGEDANDQT